MGQIFNREVWNVLGERLALALQQVVAGLGALELALHQPQLLARLEYLLSHLILVSLVLHHNLVNTLNMHTPLPDMARWWWADREAG